MELTNKELAVQDMVDNVCQNLIIEAVKIFSPELRKRPQDITWDMERIGHIRDALQDIIVDKLKLCTEREFYPCVE